MLKPKTFHFGSNGTFPHLKYISLTHTKYVYILLVNIVSQTFEKNININNIFVAQNRFITSKIACITEIYYKLFMFIFGKVCDFQSNRYILCFTLNVNKFLSHYLHYFENFAF